MENKPDTISSAFKYIKNELIALYPIEEIQGFSWIIIENVLKLSRTQVHTHPDRNLTLDEVKRIEEIINRLKKFEPIQYIFGRTYFYNIHLNVSPGVLIPRPETEELVDWILHENKTFNGNLLDIGTGSGCIIIALAKNFSEGKFYAFDQYEEPLKIASENATLNKVKVEFYKVDILDNLHHFETKFDIIVSNPPYIPEKEKELMQKNVLDFEPETALFVSNDNPLIFYKRITDFSKHNLRKNGKLYFEINEKYGNEVVGLLAKKGFIDIELKKDINGKNRMVRAIKRF